MKIVMRKYFQVVIATLLILGNMSISNAASPWGANYFPNVPLVTHEGKIVHFFDDLIKDKVVAINFIYTHCADSCPLETAQLTRVQKIMGDRVGKDVFFYSITIDPENDTPDVLKEYREKFKARWTFLTGKKEDIILLRKKLGLYIEEIQDGSNNHNVSLIIGNQTTGRWMKRSPFENPHVLADQIGNWLTGWKVASKGKDYSTAPKLRNIPRGEQIYRTRCITCHSLDGNELTGALGPDLLGVVQRRDRQWLLNWLKAPDQMIKKKDPIALALYKQYNKLMMPNMRLNKEEVLTLLDYINDETERLSEKSKKTAAKPTLPVVVLPDSEDQAQAQAVENEVDITGAWIRETYTSEEVNAGHMTIRNNRNDPVTIVKLESKKFNNIGMYKMDRQNGLLEMSEMTNIDVPVNGHIQFDPGGKHLMLMRAREYMSKGEKVDMTVTFKSGKKQTISITVAAK